jgi:hypothetical protein
MPTADYQTAIDSLKENLRLMHDHGNKPEYRVLYNLSNALIVVCDGLRHLEEKKVAGEKE